MTLPEWNVEKTLATPEEVAKVETYTDPILELIGGLVMDEEIPPRLMVSALHQMARALTVGTQAAFNGVV